MNSFTIRVYGLMINQNCEVLVSDEFREGIAFTKFPGGGLEFGEGISSALIREYKEELDLEVSVESLFYVNDHLQVSAFNEQTQLLAFYYFVKTLCIENLIFESYEIPLKMNGEKQRWLPINSDLENVLTFPLDKIVASKLIEKHY
jgi:ADP-ribose pyrophosphatase YjhB (NUDIX family)